MDNKQRRIFLKKNIGDILRIQKKLKITPKDKTTLKTFLNKESRIHTNTIRKILNSYDTDDKKIVDKYKSYTDTAFKPLYISKKGDVESYPSKLSIEKRDKMIENEREKHFKITRQLIRKKIVSRNMTYRDYITFDLTIIIKYLDDNSKLQKKVLTLSTMKQKKKMINRIYMRKGMLYDNLEINNGYLRINEFDNNTKVRDRKDAFFKVMDNMITIKIYEYLYDFIPYIEDEIKKIKNHYRMVKQQSNIKLDISRFTGQKISKAPRYKQFFKYGSINCVLKTILKQWGNVDDKLINKLNDKYFNNGVGEDELEHIAKVLKCNFRIYNQIGNVIKEVIKYPTHKIIKLYNLFFNHIEENTDQLNLFGFKYKKEWIPKTGDEMMDILTNKNNDDYKPLKIINESNDKNDFSPDMLIFNNYIYYKKDGECDILDYNTAINQFFEQFSENDYMYYNTQRELYDYSMSSIHFPCVYVRTKLKKKLRNDYIQLDKNKAYGSYRYNKYYDECLFPNGLLGIYQNTDNLPTKDIVDKAGVSTIYNIDYSNLNDNEKKYFNTLNFLVEYNTYPNNYLYYCYNVLNIHFDIKIMAFSNTKKDITINEDYIKKYGIHKMLYGVCQYGRDIKEIKLHSEHQTLNNFVNDLCSDDDYFINNNIKTHYNNDCDELDYGTTEELIQNVNKEQIQVQDDNIIICKNIKDKRNLSYVSSYIIGYNLIDMLDKLRHIDFEHVIKVHTDSILFKNEYRYTKLFNINKKIGGWKEEETKVYGSSDDILKDNGYYADVFSDDYLPLTPDKLKYTDINLITGGAGCGKTTRMLNKDFKEQLHNSIYLYPSHDLKQILIDKYSVDVPINAITYQLFISDGFYKNPAYRYILRCKNVIVDEITMINKKEINKIVTMCKKHNFNLILLGDMDEKRIYQLKTPDGDTIDMKFINSFNPYHVILTKIYRNGGELLKRLLKIRSDDLKNKEILELFEDRKINFDIMAKMYNIDTNNIILSSKNTVVRDFNLSLYNQYNKVIVKDLKTAQDTVKNRRKLINKKEISQLHLKYINGGIPEKINKALGYAITSHLCQGQTYTGHIFIDINNLFTPNLLYVMLSRAVCLEHIHILIK